MPAEDLSGRLTSVPALRERFRRLLTGSVCLVGIGNRQRADDGAGPLVIDALRERVAAPCLDAGMAPENLLEPILAQGADTIVFLDAADFGGQPGDVRVLDPAQATAGRISTHGMPLALLCGYLRQRQAGRVHLIAIQPACLDAGGALSPAVQAAVEHVSAALIGALAGGGPRPGRAGR